MEKTKRPARAETIGGDGLPKLISLIRVSTAEQAAEGKAGVTRQEEHNREAAKMLGLPISHEVCAIDVSGKHVNTDPQFLQLFEDLKRPDILGVIVTEQSRLFRPARYDDYEILQKFADAKKKIWVKTSCFDPCVQQGRMGLMMGGIMSGEELLTIRARMEDGKDKARREGLNPGSNQLIPKGVKYIRPRDTNGTRIRGAERWELDPVESAKIRRAYELLLDGYSYKHIGREIGRPANTLRDTLSNPIWIGRRQFKYQASDVEYVSGKGKIKHRIVLRDNPLQVEIKIEKLVSEAVFNRAQLLIAERKTNWRKSTVKEDARARPLLNGIGRCSCGATLYVRYGGLNRKHQSDRYFCSTRLHRNNATFCGAPDIRRDKVDAELTRIVQEKLSNAAFIRRNAEKVATVKKVDTGKATREAAVKNMAGQRARLIDMFQTGMITKEEYRDRIKRIDVERRAIEATAPTVLPQQITPAEIAQLFTKLFVNFNLLHQRTQRDLLMKAFNHITIDGRVPGGVAGVSLKPRFAIENEVVNSHDGSRVTAQINYPETPFEINIRLARAA